MTEFNKGDRIRATSDTGHSKIFWLAEEPETGELITFHAFDPFCPVVPFDAVLAGNDGSLTFEVEVAAEDALPTEPGEYEDVARYYATEAVRGSALHREMVESGDWRNDEPWVLEADGGWTSPTGDHRGPEEAWSLAATGFEFVPWAERDTIPARFENPRKDLTELFTEVYKDESFDLAT